jgi:hypothetical protein
MTKFSLFVIAFRYTKQKEWNQLILGQNFLF